jgi:hypothetical protein
MFLMTHGMPLVNLFVHQDKLERGGFRQVTPSKKGAGAVKVANTHNAIADASW